MARGHSRLLIQPIPPVDYSVRKKCLQQSRVHLIFADLSECPLVPLVFSSKANNSERGCMLRDLVPARSRVSL